MNKIIIPCEEANHVCDKSQYKESTLWEKIKLNIHLLYCSACRNYTKNNVKLTKIINGNKKVEPITANDKEKLKSAFEKELAKHQQ